MDSNNANYIESKDDPIKLKVNKTLISEESSLKEIKNDTLRVEFKVNTENLNKYKYDSEYLEKINWLVLNFLRELMMMMHGMLNQKLMILSLKYMLR